MWIIRDSNNSPHDRFGIEVPLSQFGTPTRRWLRVSAQIYNSPAEYEYLAEVLAELNP
jgi:isopenicillin-N epimerase